VGGWGGGARLGGAPMRRIKGTPQKKLYMWVSGDADQMKTTTTGEKRECCSRGPKNPRYQAEGVHGNRKSGASVETKARNIRQVRKPDGAWEAQPERRGSRKSVKRLGVRNFRVTFLAGRGLGGENVALNWQGQLREKGLRRQQGSERRTGGTQKGSQGGKK